MLKSLKIKNYILVKELALEFTAGLNIFSGETGAGKSVIIEAINTVLGGNVRPGMVFQDNEAAEIEVCFDVDKSNQALIELINEYELDCDEGELFVSKIISSSLKAKTYLNGVRSTNSIVRKFKAAIIDFHSQRDQQRLFNNDYQLEILDAFGRHDQELADFQDKYHQHHNILRQYHNLLNQEKANRDKFDLYSYQLEEIENAGISAGEDEQLNEELILLLNSEELLELQESFGQDCLEGENSLFDKINYFLSRLMSYEGDSLNIRNASSILRDCLANLEAANSELLDLKSSIDLDPLRLQDVTARLDFLNSLKMKYKRSLEEIIIYEQEIRNFIAGFSSDQEKISRLKDEIAASLTNLQDSAEKLSLLRKKTAAKFSSLMQKNIKLLAMPAAQVEIRFYDLTKDKEDYFSQLAASGKDQVEIYFTANLGVEMQPLKVAASGGELSRFLLAVKKLLASYLYTKSIIFDEIDTGIGGRTAEYTGEYINTIAGHHQVICITHLAQIAVFAATHLLIEKKNDQNISFIIVKKLDNKNRVNEIARMLSGSDSDLALNHAEELLNKAGKN
ncbi:MAG: DNA repair protein RecN [Candidatus Cloacimonetes bacterium]|nr:DNA repair protein RecN [Candidatus Cloacimonadota bacterium]